MSGQISTRCPHCSKKFKLKNESAVGKKVPCPQCKQPFVVTPLEPQPAAAQPAVADDDWMSDFNDSGTGGSTAETYGVSRDLPPVVQSETTKPKRKRISSYEGDDSSSYYAQDSGRREVATAVMIWILGGSIAGLLGALAWGGIIYAVDREIGWIAIGIGAAVGFGVSVTAGGNAGELSGIIAVVVSLLSIFAGKVFGVWLLIGSILPEIPAELGIFTLCSLVFQSLGPFDGLWAVLAGMTAYRIGADTDDD